MAPPRKIIRQQQEILIEFLEENRDVANGIPPGAPISHQPSRQKWTMLAKKLNSVNGGVTKTPDGWKKYWFEWRHKCRKKAADARRYQSGSDMGRNRFVPLNDLEIRVLELSGKGSVTPSVPMSQQLDDFLAEDSDSEQPLETIKIQAAQVTVKPRQSVSSTSKHFVNCAEDQTRPSTPPPKWAIDLETRRIAAEERMAEALMSMAAVMKSQEERRAMLDERIADAITTIAGTVQDLNSGVQEALRHLQQLHPIQSNGPSLKRDVFL
ncbi:uncharacterized protein LOC126378370 [Pectinophora gossypiella]|uniref:uncharacterized protein LOC126378370 n=1 Tax=Pectinophora gossypiella TaxID=13191 RepID=UPI00214E437A|nr:uncharacterized protein LOC126378370 [Pectinophora gossypiella]